MRRLMCLFLLLPGPLAAQSGTICAGRATLEQVITTERGSNNYDYALRLRNDTPRRVIVDVEFGNFPNSVSLNNRRIANIVLGGAVVQERLNFAHGSERDFGRRGVVILHDAQTSPRPHVRLTNCRFA